MNKQGKSIFFLCDKNNQNLFFCFSPEVMLATFLIEVAAAIYVFFRYKTTVFSRIVISILLLLAGFQFIEYQICEIGDSLILTRLGFVFITILPVLALHLTYTITGSRHFLKLGYVLMFAFILIYAFAENAVTSSAVCTGNYIVFYSQTELAWLYAGYYFLFLLLGIWEALEGLLENKGERKALVWLIIGYLSFMLPMGIVYLISPPARDAIPSIMCGFALLFGLILAIKVAPRYYKNLG